MIHTLKILNQHGDEVITWDRDLEKAVDDVFTQADAKAAFDKMKDEGRYLAYRTDADGQNAEVIREFDPTAPQILMTPQLVGG